MLQNNIEALLKANPLIPVVTIESLDEVDVVYENLSSQGINCVEITLRTEIAWEAIALFKEKYGPAFKVGVGTIISPDDILKCVKLKVDFMVSPGLTSSMIQQFDFSGIPFLPGVSTPSEIIRGIDMGWRVFKFFPADLFGGAKALKVYGNIFKDVSFCPTGGINKDNYQEYLDLKNVMAVGGSWLTSD
ncbi:MAG: 2-dehydro-3-deoxyphosphogluconate aldolase/(4S)-4-hydroxy-2-oxoglutarate aldolase [Crocinitomicaceae bacterium]|jgi:2-dehydro-3-deoxyphosphogluconate aldolase/(4S)-4-hydroxy-2-oxoglutarate aldolase